MIYTVNGAAYDSEYLCHHGAKGQRWGVRRYQNEDGTLTAAGRERYLVGRGQSDLRSKIPTVGTTAFRRHVSETQPLSNFGKNKVPEDHLGERKVYLKIKQESTLPIRNKDKLKLEGLKREKERLQKQLDLENKKTGMMRSNIRINKIKDKMFLLDEAYDREVDAIIKKNLNEAVGTVAAVTSKQDDATKSRVRNFLMLAYDRRMHKYKNK